MNSSTKVTEFASICPMAPNGTRTDAPDGRTSREFIALCVREMAVIGYPDDTAADSEGSYDSHPRCGLPMWHR